MRGPRRGMCRGPRMFLKENRTGKSREKAGAFFMGVVTPKGKQPA